MLYMLEDLGILAPALEMCPSMVLRDLRDALDCGYTLGTSWVVERALEPLPIPGALLNDNALYLC